MNTINIKKIGPRRVVLLVDNTRGHFHQSQGIARWLERLCGAEKETACPHGKGKGHDSCGSGRAEIREADGGVGGKTDARLKILTFFYESALKCS